MSNSDHHPDEEQVQVPDLRTIENSIPTPRSNHQDDDLHASDSDPLSPRHAYLLFPNSDPDEDSDSTLDSDSTDQMNFITDLFASREGEFVSDDEDSDSDPALDSLLNDAAFRVFQRSDRFGSGYEEELRLGFGSRIGFSSVAPASSFNGSLIDDVNFRVFEGYSSNHGEELGLGFGSPTRIGGVSSTSESSDCLTEDEDFRVFEGCDGYGSNDGEELGLGLGYGSPMGTGSVSQASDLGDSSTVDVGFEVSEGFDGYGSNHVEELGLGLGFRFGSPNRIGSVGLMSHWEDSLANSRANSGTDGLRVAGIESDSDSDEVAQYENNDENNGEPFRVLDIPLFWDCLGFEEQRASRTEEFDWEEVDHRVDERDSLSSIIGSFEELSVSSETSSAEEGMRGIGRELFRNLQRELILSVYNMGRTHESDHDADMDYVSYLRQGHAYEADYDTVFGQFVQSESAVKGSPPASKAVMENLPCLVLRKEDLRDNCVVCAVCKDEAFVGEKLTRLPCCHLYHWDCIEPWLCIRNTCPVCRYELPTDDLDYEQRKTEREGVDLPQDLQMLEFIHRVAES